MPRPQANQTGDEGNATSHWVSPCQFPWTQRWGGHQTTVERGAGQAWGQHLIAPWPKLAYMESPALFCCLLEALSPRPAAHRDPRKSETPVAPPCIPLGPSRVSGQESPPPKVLIVLEATVGSTGGAVATVLIPPNRADPRRLMSFVILCTRTPLPTKSPGRKALMGILFTDQDGHSDFTA